MCTSLALCICSSKQLDIIYTCLINFRSIYSNISFPFLERLSIAKKTTKLTLANLNEHN